MARIHPTAIIEENVTLGEANTGGYAEEKHLLEGVRFIWHHVVTFVLPADILSSAEPSAFSVFRVWLVRFLIAALTVLTITNRKNISGRSVGLGTLTAVIGFFLLAAYFIVGPT